MDHLSSLILIRGLERLLAVAFSGVSLILGWHLFKTGVLADQTAEIQKGDMLLKLQRVGPGVFFALFGTAILIFALSRPFDYKPTSVEGQTDGKANPVQVTYLKNDQKKFQQLAKAVNTLNHIIKDLPPTIVHEHDKLLLKKALAILDQEKRSWVLTLYGEDELRLWNQYSERYLLNPDQIGKEKREVLNKIRPWMNDTLKLTNRSLK